MVPLAIVGIVRDIAVAGWDLLCNGLCASIAEAVEILITAIIAIIFGATDERHR